MCIYFAWYLPWHVTVTWDCDMNQWVWHGEKPGPYSNKNFAKQCSHDSIFFWSFCKISCIKWKYFHLQSIFRLIRSFEFYNVIACGKKSSFLFWFQNGSLSCEFKVSWPCGSFSVCFECMKDVLDTLNSSIWFEILLEIIHQDLSLPTVHYWQLFNFFWVFNGLWQIAGTYRSAVMQLFWKFFANFLGEALLNFLKKSDNCGI